MDATFSNKEVLYASASPLGCDRLPVRPVRPADNRARAVQRGQCGRHGGGGSSGAKQPVAVGTGGGVASMDLGASQAGINALKHGGNAGDAAVATASPLG